MTNIQLIDCLEAGENLAANQWVQLLSSYSASDREYAAVRAREIAHRYFDNKVYTRGLIEFTSWCRNDCYYCGIRRSNQNAERYRLTEEQILDCCKEGYRLGFRTFVLQGGEDGYYTDERIVSIVSKIHVEYPDCAITLSIGEREEESYRRFFAAGATRYLLRHETADREHYRKLHPEEMSFDHRIECLYTLKKIGFQTGCGFMVGSPGQTPETLAQDMMLIAKLHPQMVGIGPFIPHKDTSFWQEPAGALELTLFLLSLIRIMEKNVLLPATTALGTIAPNGRELGILAGANVVMPNLSPVAVRKKYALYDNKICTGEEAAECRGCLAGRMQRIGYRIVSDRGDWKERKETDGVQV